MQIGNHLRTYRKNRHFTQEYVANELHISRQAISAWENDASFPDLENLVLLSRLYEASVDELIGNATPAVVAIEEDSAPTQEEILSSEVVQDASGTVSEDTVSSKLESIFLILLAIAAFELPFFGVFLLIYVVKTIRSRLYLKGIVLFICVACIIHDLVYYAQFFS